MKAALPPAASSTVPPAITPRLGSACGLSLVRTIVTSASPRVTRWPGVGGTPWSGSASGATGSAPGCPAPGSPVSACSDVDGEALGGATSPSDEGSKTAVAAASRGPVSAEGSAAASPASIDSASIIRSAARSATTVSARA